MSTPIIILAGAAGTGKDTVADILCRKHGAVAIAQADPMKRLAAKVFDFSADQLWGPSQNRNAADNRFTGEIRAFNTAADKLQQCGLPWVVSLLPGVDRDTHLDAFWHLKKWMTNLSRHHLQEQKPLTPRYTLQTLGTEWGRLFSKNIWVDYTLRQALTLLGGGHSYNRELGTTIDDQTPLPAFVVVTDGRFPNEIITIKGAGGMAMRLVSSDLSASAQQAGVVGHASETSLGGIPEGWFDITLSNDKALGLAALETKLETFSEGIPGLGVKIK